MVLSVAFCLLSCPQENSRNQHQTITNLAGLPLPENETTPFDGMDMSVLLVQAAATGISSDGGFGSSGSPNLVKPFGFTAAFSQYPRRSVGSVVYCHAMSYHTSLANVWNVNAVPRNVSSFRK